MADTNLLKMKDISTEKSIKIAARMVFHEKGFAATRTRDIAEKAGINLALLNYYFRSKQKLFDIIMFETMMQFMQSIIVVFNDDSTTLDNKIESIINGYIDLLVVEPQIPLFIMHELKNGQVPHFFTQFDLKDKLLTSVFVRQYQDAIQSGYYKNIPFIHFLMNLMGLCVFPFIASPVIKMMGNLDDPHYKQVMIERKIYIAEWINDIIKVKS
ncbi:MAG: TetR/AcrR family transcriptional regulator [Saprospiraceae bacterium]